MRSFILTLVAAASAFALLATSAEAGDRKKNRRDRDDYGYYQRDRGNDRRARVVRQRDRDDDRPARIVRQRDRDPRVRVWIQF
jgi:Ni/Co efflux regulator RcnB